VINLLVTIVILLLVFAVIAYIVNTYFPFDPHLKQLILLILGVVLIIWILLAVTGYAPLMPLHQGGVR
jgi:hypothetical protein